jgi:DNA-binding CsgD family transcriptional regulator
MDQVDVALNQAWFAMLDRIARDPAELARRRERAARVRQRPVRPWCLAIRAGDTRIDEWGLSWSVNDDAQHGRPHTLEITQWDLADLTAPIDLGPWPGVRAVEAAKLLGRNPSVINSWIRRGVLNMEYVDPRALDMRAGPPQPMVWSLSPLDPNADNGRPPHTVWGTLWQGLARDVPRDWACKLQRVPSPTPSPHGGVYWRWVCPGRWHRRPACVADTGGTGVSPVIESDGATSQAGRLSHTPCGRLCSTLYLPLPCWTIANFRGEMESLGIPTPPWADLAGQPPACGVCWNIDAKRMRNTAAWNMFVSHVSGGMLTGSEVPRPEADAPYEPKRADKPRPPMPHVARRREQIRDMLLAGHSYAEIQKELGIPRTMLADDAKKIYRAAGIAPQPNARVALVRKSQWSGAAEIDEGALLGLRGRPGRLARLLVRGWSMREIAEELNIKHGSAQTAAHRLYKKLGIHSQEQLRKLALAAATKQAPPEAPAIPATNTPAIRAAS